MAAACTAPAGAWLTRQLPESALLLVMRGLVTVAVLLVMRGVLVHTLRGTKGAVAAGAVGGFTNAAAGVGGPPVSLYAVNSATTFSCSRSRSGRLGAVSAPARTAESL